MAKMNIDRIRPYFITILILILALFVVWIRLLPAPQLISGNQFVLGQEPDISYNLRLIEQMIRNFPNYPGFEAMTRYPYGTLISWGPMFTFIVSALCLLTGAATQLEIASIAFAVPPVLAAIMIPVMFYIGKYLADWKTGLISAIFISIVSGQFLYRSLYGFADHHIAEVLFSTIFCLSYIVALVYTKKEKLDLLKPHTLKNSIFLAVIAGITFILGFLTMPTMILFAFIVALFTLAQFSIDLYKNQKSDYLLLLNVVTFGITIIGVLIAGFRTPDLVLVLYSPAHIIAYALVIIGSVALFILARIFEKRKIYYPISIVLLIVAGMGLIALVFSGVYSAFLQGFNLMFGAGAVTLTIQELRPWSLSEAWFTFNFGFILMIGGICYTAYTNFKEEKPEHIFVLVWSLVILYATFNHVRYEYYLSPVIAMLAALFTGAVLSMGYLDVHQFLLGRRKVDQQAEEKSPLRKKGKAEKKSARKSSFDSSLVIAFFFIAAFAVLFIGMSASYNYQVGSAMGYNIMHPDWRETLEWMGNNTPETGVDYYSIYTQAAFQYPPQSYGVMSWWDYGHWITFFAHRIPHANPFQEGVVGVNGSASFFMAMTEEQTISIANNLTTKFVVTDIEMDMGKFWAMSTWYNETLGDRPYHQIYLVTSPDNPTTYELVSLTTQAYYLTTISRLHNFDGSMTDPTIAYYIEYRDGTTATRNYPIVTRVEVMNASEAAGMATDYNKIAPTGSHATVLMPSTSLTSPITRVPALQHFRLIYESPTNVMGNSGDLRYVKAFEYVKGAHIKGEGIIEIPIVTNGGRTFIYRQESVSGEFIVPYPTEKSPYEVKATGPYRISGTNSTFIVSEDAVQQGLTLN